MIVTRDTRPWVCSADAPVVEALAQISAHRHGGVFCVEADGRLVGVLTDGDFRRRVVAEPGLDLDRPVRDIANLAPLTAPAGATPAELALVAGLAREHGALVISDEVYEHLLFTDGPTGGRHVPVATLPGMAERTLTISSAGKTFSVTGWKVGWVHGPAELVDAVRAVKQFVTFVASGPFQPAVAVGLGLPDEVYAELAARLQAGRDLLCEGLRAAGFSPLVPAGTYFVVVDGADLGYPDGLALCRDLPDLAGVVGVPVGVFHDDPQAGRSLVRFAFCKRPEVLEAAAERLARLRR